MWFRKLLFFIVMILFVAGLAWISCSYNQEYYENNGRTPGYADKRD